jgi:hypothetical protein
MSILQNLKQVHAAVVLDNTRAGLGVEGAGKLGRAIGAKAVLAIFGGINSDAWRDYMALFANNETELERLRVRKDGEPNWLPQFRAYIVSNAVCEASTNTYTNSRVNEDIDSGFTAADMAPDANFINARVIVIPPV